MVIPTKNYVEFDAEKKNVLMPLTVVPGMLFDWIEDLSFKTEIFFKVLFSILSIH